MPNPTLIFPGICWTTVFCTFAMQADYKFDNIRRKYALIQCVNVNFLNADL